MHAQLILSQPRARIQIGLLSRHLQPQLTRQLSSATTRFMKDVLKRATILTVYICASVGLVMVMVFGVQKEILDQKFNTPKEWSWTASRTYKGAHLEAVQGRRSGLMNWAGVGQHFLGAARALEDTEADGKGLKLIRYEDTDSKAEKEGEPVFDVSEKSDEWIHGYHSCLMGVAKSAENCEGMFIDTTQNLLCPKDVMIGPSNPRPKPMSIGSSFKPPLEEDCVPVFKSPEIYYLKVLHTYGFNARQRLEAALGLADWYDYKGLDQRAEEMYDWGLDIAQGALPTGVNEVVDMKTGIITNNTAFVSANMLTATTALAQYQARHNKLSEALPIFLSILRARRQLLKADDMPLKQEAVPGTWAEFYLTAKDILFPPPRPALPTDGNEPPLRTPAAVCEEAAVMSHIGEILLASSLSQDQTQAASKTSKGPSSVQNTEGFRSGLSWTRDAVDLAEETLLSLGPGEVSKEARTKCTQCLAVGIDNWSSMVHKMLREAQTTGIKPKKSSVGNLFWGRDEENESLGQWEGEAKVVDARSNKIRKLIATEEQRPLPWWMTVITRE